MVDTFTNPIIPGFNPDPSICRVGSDYFLVTSTFEYFPGLPIYHSKDLLNWTLIGHVLTRRSQLDMRTTEPSGGVWAPAIRFHKGTFYVSTGCTQRFRPKEWDIVIPRGFYVTTTDIWAADSWSDPIYFDVPGIDQDLFFDDDGKVYFSAVNQITDPSVPKHALGLATFTAEIDIKTGRCLSAAKWNCLSSFGMGIAEGPHIFKYGGYYYLSTAEGGTDEGHQQWIRRSKVGPFGPWEEGPHDSINPVIYNGDHAQVRNTGHLDFIERENGSWFAVFLGVRPQGEDSSLLSSIGRETFLAPVEWVNGWPVVNKRQRISLQMPKHGLVTEQKLVRSWRDDFQGSTELQLGWYHLRTPLKKEYSLEDHPGSLSLYGGAYRIFDSECPSMLLRKQTQFSVDWRVGLKFSPENANEEAGTAIWWSQFAYASIGIRRGESGLEITFRGYDDQSDAFQETTSPMPPTTEEIQLLIRARPTKYELLFSPSPSTDINNTENEYTKLGEITSSALTVRRSGKESPNTGSHFAIYAQGGFGKPCLKPAVFTFAEWKCVD